MKKGLETKKHLKKKKKTTNHCGKKQGNKDKKLTCFFYFKVYEVRCWIFKIGSGKCHLGIVYSQYWLK
jgi:hypothetical protein